MNQLRYAVFPESLPSVRDGQFHFISFDKLVRLYGVDPRECVDMSRPEKAHGVDVSQLWPLHVRFSGNYPDITKDHYPPDWPRIAERTKAAAGGRCERCKHPHDLATGHVLTVHHLDGVKANCADWNLAALCQRCHLAIQGRIKLDQNFFEIILPVSEWFRPHLDGFMASKNWQPKPKETV